MKSPEAGGTPHNQDHQHFKAVRNQGDFRDATTAGPDAWKYDNKIFREGTTGGMNALNRRISIMASLKEADKSRRRWVAGSKMGKQELNTSDNPDTERTNERLDDQFDGYVRGLQDAREMLSKHITGHLVWVESDLDKDGGYSATRDRRQGQK